MVKKSDKFVIYSQALNGKRKEMEDMSETNIISTNVSGKTPSYLIVRVELTHKIAFILGLFVGVFVLRHQVCKKKLNMHVI